MFAFFDFHALAPYRGAIIGIVGGIGWLVAAGVQWKKDKSFWAAVDVLIALVFFTQGISDIMEVPSNVKMSQSLDTATNALAGATNEVNALSNALNTATNKIATLSEQLATNSAEFEMTAKPMDVKDKDPSWLALTNFAGTEVITSCIQDPKAQSTLIGLERVFGKAGWQIVGHLPISGICNDVCIAVNMNDPCVAAARRLTIMLNNKGVPATLEQVVFTVGAPPSNTISVVVGQRPSPLESKWLMRSAQSEEVEEQLGVLRIEEESLYKGLKSGADISEFWRKHDELMKQERKLQEKQMAITFSPLR